MKRVVAYAFSVILFFDNAAIVGAKTTPGAITHHRVISACEPNAFRSVTQTATIPRECFTRAIWIANALDHIRNSSAYQYVVVADAIDLLLQQNPLPAASAIDAQMTAALSAFQTNTNRVQILDDRSTPYEIISAMYRSLLGTTTITPRQLALRSIGWAQNGTLAGHNASLDEVLQAARDNSWTAVEPLAKTAFGHLYDDGRDAANAVVIDKFLVPAIQAHVGDSSDTIVAANAHLNQNPTIVDLQKQFQSGSATINIPDLVKAAGGGIARLRSQLDAGTAKLKDIDAAQKDVFAYDPNSTDAVKLRQEAAQYQSAANAAADTAEAAAYVVGSLASLIDAGVGGRITSAGVGAAGLVRTVASYAVSATQIGAAVFGFASSVASGNFIGAVGSIFGFFDDGGPSQSELEMKSQLSQIQSQLGELQRNMNERFDRIDTELNTIYTEMNARFDHLDKETVYIKGQVDAIRSSLIQFEAQFNRFETNVSVYFADQAYTQFNSTITYLDSPNPDPGGFNNAENQLYDWATFNYLQSYAAGPPNRLFDDQHLLSELSGFPVERNINYLNEYPKTMGLAPLSSTRVGNYRDWLTAVRAYFHYVALTPNVKLSQPRLVEMEKAGVQLRRAIMTIGQPAPAKNRARFRGHTDATNPLLLRVLDKVSSKIKQFGIASEGVQDGVTASHVRSSAWISRGVDAVGGDVVYLRHAVTVKEVARGTDVWYSKPFLALTDSIQRCGGSPTSGRPMEVISRAQALLVEPEISVAAALGNGTLKACYNVVPTITGTYWYQPVHQCVPHECPPPQPGYWMNTYSLAMTATIQYSDGAHGAMPISVRRWTYSAEGGLTTPIDAVVADYWAQMTPLAGAATEQISADQRRAAVEAARAVADPVVTQIQETVVGTLSLRHRLEKKNPLNGSVNRALDARDELDGAKKLLAAYTTLGLPTLIERNDLAHAALFGTQGLLSSDVLVANFLAMPRPRHENVLQNVGNGTSKRIGAFHAALQGAYAKPNGADTYSELSIAIDQLDMLVAATRRSPRH